MRIRLTRAPVILLSASLGVAAGTIGAVLLTGEDGQAARDAAPPGPAGDLEIQRQVALSPVLPSKTGGLDRGTAFPVRPSGKSRLNIVVIARLRASEDGEAYKAWLYNSVGDAHALGALQPAKRALFRAEAPLPPGYAKRWRYIDISRERVRRNGGKRRGRYPSGESVLRGELGAR